MLRSFCSIGTRKVTYLFFFSKKKITFDVSSDRVVFFRIFAGFCFSREIISAYSFMVGLIKNQSCTKFPPGKLSRCRIPECDVSSEYQESWLPNAIPYERNTGKYQKCLRFGTSENGSRIDDDSCSAARFDRSNVLRCDQFVFKSDEHRIMKEVSEKCFVYVYIFGLVYIAWKVVLKVVPYLITKCSILGISFSSICIARKMSIN